MIFFHKATRMNTNWWHTYLFSVSLQKHAESLELDMALITLTNPAPSTLRLRNDTSLHFDCGRIEIIARFTDPVSRLLRNHRSASRYLVMIKNEQVSGCRLTRGTQAFFLSLCLSLILSLSLSVSVSLCVCVCLCLCLSLSVCLSFKFYYIFLGNLLRSSST